jgi:alkanesulfonate monooxygenase SsuD/methylene tetrahydromethanopterin reductase-like flavin-dependent oxidoreductase (luciferase family)
MQLDRNVREEWLAVANDKVVELGLDTFGDVTETGDGELGSQAQTIRDVIAEGVLADEVGVDFFGVGEHHRPDFAVSSPEMVLASIASRTERVRLGSAVTVLSSDDPVRVYQRFATLDAASNGRADVILGRRKPVRSCGPTSRRAGTESERRVAGLP